MVLLCILLYWLREENIKTFLFYMILVYNNEKL